MNKNILFNTISFFVNIYCECFNDFQKVLINQSSNYEMKWNVYIKTEKFTIYWKYLKWMWHAIVQVVQYRRNRKKTWYIDLPKRTQKNPKGPKRNTKGPKRNYLERFYKDFIFYLIKIFVKDENNSILFQIRLLYGLFHKTMANRNVKKKNVIFVIL